MAMKNIAVFLLIVLCAVGSYAYSSGAGSGACAFMVPGHGTTQQTSPSPYTISVSSSTYIPGGTVQVTISGSTTAFKGVLLQARPKLALGQSFVQLGNWTSPPSGYKLKDCNNAGDSVTHDSADPKTTATLTWNVPADFQDNVEFIATFVQEKIVYWQFLKSPILSMGTPGDGAGTVEPSAEPSAEPSPEPNYNTTRPTNGVSSFACYKVLMFLTALCSVILKNSNL